ncbi:MAG TPA: hypothetical protein DD435_11390, partial [Cyanobacteria bacterium UBA8530]|nr:hypothetical protein [Cyanobacteria bacterium UBA8530]
MLTIGIDGRFAVRQRRGIGNYSANLLRHLARIDETNRYIIYVDREDEENVLPRGGNFTVKKLFPKDYAFWEQIILPLQAALDRVDLLHCIGNTAPRFLHPRIKLISTIHDAIFFRGEDLFPISTDPLQRRMRRYRQNNIRRSASRLSRVITVSHHSKEALLSYLPSLRPEMISVIPLAPKEEFCQFPHEAAAPSFPEGYVFAVGCREPRKNTMRIIEAFLELKAEKAIPESLVIAGVSDWRKSAFFKRVAVSPHANSVFFTDYLSESELRAHYRGAKIFLYPSLYEGFGFPPLEAMACG